MSSNGHGYHQQLATSSGCQADQSSHYVPDRKRNHADTPYHKDSKLFNMLSTSSQDQPQQSYLQEDSIGHNYKVDDPCQFQNIAEESQPEQQDSTNEAFDIEDEINPVVCWCLHKDKLPRKYFVKLSQWRYPFMT